MIRSYIILNLNFTKIFICRLLICQSHEKNDMHCEIKKNEKIILHFNNKEFSQKCGLSKKKCIRWLKSEIGLISVQSYLKKKLIDPSYNLLMCRAFLLKEINVILQWPLPPRSLNCVYIDPTLVFFKDIYRDNVISMFRVNTLYHLCRLSRPHWKTRL